MNKVSVKTIAAVEGDTVQITWVCKDGSLFTQTVTVPPKNTRIVRSIT